MKGFQPPPRSVAARGQRFANAGRPIAQADIAVVLAGIAELHKPVIFIGDYEWFLVLATVPRQGKDTPGKDSCWIVTHTLCAKNGCLDEHRETVVKPGFDKLPQAWAKPDIFGTGSPGQEVTSRIADYSGSGADYLIL